MKFRNEFWLIIFREYIIPNLFAVRECQLRKGLCLNRNQLHIRGHYTISHKVLTYSPMKRRYISTTLYGGTMCRRTSCSYCRYSIILITVPTPAGHVRQHVMHASTSYMSEPHERQRTSREPAPYVPYTISRMKTRISKTQGGRYLNIS
jgi:hypothetical protein